MVVNDTTVMFAIAVGFTYLVLYKKNKLLGNLAFLSIAIAMWFFMDGTTEKAFGMVFFFGGLANTVYDFVLTRK